MKPPPIHLPPEIRPDEVVIHLIEPGKMDPQVASACLIRDELSRAAKFHFEKDKNHWICFRAGLRTILGQTLGLPAAEVPLFLSGHGKPLLPPPHDWLHFNLSHCEQLAVVAVSTIGPVGVDLEPLHRADSLLECEATFCHPQEIAALPDKPGPRAAALLKIWTNKEALLKSLGTGLSLPPETIEIHTDASGSHATSDQHLRGIESLAIFKLEDPALADYQTSVCVPTKMKPTIIFAQPFLLC